ncbi:hypothetical protein ES707_04897 [subsurface metagenome]
MGRIAPLTEKMKMDNRSSKKIDCESGAEGEGRREPRRLGEGKLCYTVPEAAALLGLSRNNGYALARSGELPVVRFGNRILVPIAKFHRMLGDYPESGEGKI